MKPLTAEMQHHLQDISEGESVGPGYCRRCVWLTQNGYTFIINSTVHFTSLGHSVRALLEGVSYVNDADA